MQQAVWILLAQLRPWPCLRLLCWLQPVYISAAWVRSFFVLANRARDGSAGLLFGPCSNSGLRIKRESLTFMSSVAAVAGCKEPGQHSVCSMLTSGLMWFIPVQHEL